MKYVFNLLVITAWFAVFLLFIVGLSFGWAGVMDALTAVTEALAGLVDQIAGDWWIFSRDAGKLGFLIALVVMVGVIFASLGIVGAVMLLIGSVIRKVLGGEKR